MRIVPQAWCVHLAVLVAATGARVLAAPASFGAFPERVVQDDFTSLRSVWKTDGSTWRHAGGVFSQEDVAAVHWALLEHALSAPIASVEADVRLDSDAGRVGVVFAYRGVRCRWILAAPGAGGAVEGFSVPVTVTATPELVVGAWRRISFVLEDDFVIARVDGATAWYVEDSSPLGVSNGELPALPADGFAFFTEQAAASFDSIVVERPREAWRYFVPVAPRTPGMQGTLWRTDLALSNLSPLPATVTVYYLHAGQDNTALTTVAEVTLTGGESRVLVDAIAAVLGLGQANGGLMIVSDGELAAASRTYNQTGDGSYGQHVPAVLVDDLHPAGDAVALVGARRSTSYRTNVGLLNPSRRTAKFTVRLVDGDGVVRGSLQRSVKPLSQHQYTDVLPALGADLLAAGRVEVSADGPFLAYAMVIDNASGDPILLPGARVATANRTRDVPNLARLKGLNGSNWRSQVFVTNLEAVAGELTLSFFLKDRSEVAAFKTLHIPANATLAIDDIVWEMLKREGEGWLRVESTVAMIASARRYNLTGTGSTFGQSVRILAPEQMLGHGDAGVFPGAEKSSEFRSNLVVLNPGDTPATILVRVDGQGKSATKSFPLGAHTYRNLVDIVGQVGHPGGKDLRLLVALDPAVDANAGARLAASVTVLDNRTNDPVGIGHTLDRTVPVFLSLSPAGGPPGTQLRIHGAGLRDRNGLRYGFAGTELDVTATLPDARTLEATLPPLAAPPGEQLFVGDALLSVLGDRAEPCGSLTLSVETLPPVSPAAAQTLYGGLFAEMTDALGVAAEGAPPELGPVHEWLRDLLAGYADAFAAAAAGSPSTVRTYDPLTGEWSEATITTEGALALASLLQAAAGATGAPVPSSHAAGAAQLRFASSCGGFSIGALDGIGRFCNSVSSNLYYLAARSVFDFTFGTVCFFKVVPGCNVIGTAVFFFDVATTLICENAAYAVQSVVVEPAPPSSIVVVRPGEQVAFRIVANTVAAVRDGSALWTTLATQVAEVFLNKLLKGQVQMKKRERDLAVSYLSLIASKLFEALAGAGVTLPTSSVHRCSIELPPSLATAEMTSPPPDAPQGLQLRDRTVTAGEFVDTARVRARISNPNALLYAWSGAGIVNRSTVPPDAYAPATEFRLQCDGSALGGHCGPFAEAVAVTSFGWSATNIGWCQVGPNWYGWNVPAPWAGSGAWPVTALTFVHWKERWYSRGGCPTADGLWTNVRVTAGAGINRTDTLTIDLGRELARYCVVGTMLREGSLCGYSGCPEYPATVVRTPLDTQGSNTADFLAAGGYQQCP